MPIPTEPIGSIPRTADLLAAMRAHAAGGISAEQLKTAEELALRDTVTRPRSACTTAMWMGWRPRRRPTPIHIVKMDDGLPKKATSGQP